jgi:hypothetical protein
MKADELGSSRLLVSEVNCVLTTTEYEKKNGLKNKNVQVKKSLSAQARVFSFQPVK